VGDHLGRYDVFPSIKSATADAVSTLCWTGGVVCVAGGIFAFLLLAM
jgi:hypothetical protein